jgi:hypothetical protein
VRPGFTVHVSSAYLLTAADAEGGVHPKGTDDVVCCVLLSSQRCRWGLESSSAQLKEVMSQATRALALALVLYQFVVAVPSNVEDHHHNFDSLFEAVLVS